MEAMDLRQTAVSDAGLERIAKLPALKTLLLDGSQATVKNLDELRAAIGDR